MAPFVRLAFGLTFLVFLIHSPARSQGRAAWLKAGEKALANGNPYGALHCFKKAAKFDPENLDLITKIAWSARLARNYQTSAFYYSKLVEADPAFLPEAGYYKALSLKQCENYDEACMAFRKFSLSKTTGRVLDSLKVLARIELNLCGYFYDAAKPSGQKISPVDSVNSTGSEFCPWLDRGRLVFIIRDPDPQSELFRNRLVFSNGTDDWWSELAATLSAFSGEITSFCPGPGQSFFFSARVDEVSRESIFLIRRLDSGWAEPQPLQIPLPGEGFQLTHPFVVALGTENWLFFSSNHPSGFGGYDIYQAALDDHFGVHHPLLLGKEINSPGNELSPFVSPDSILYFSTDFPAGYGGLDVFESRREAGKWSVARNLGKGVNGGADDLFYKEFPEAKIGYLVSNRPTDQDLGETCCNNIFSFTVPEKSGPASQKVERDYKNELLSRELQALFPLDVFFENDQPDPRSNDTLTITDFGELFSLYLEHREEITLEYSKGLRGRMRTAAVADLDSFFVNQALPGMAKLDQGCSILGQLINEGFQFRIFLQGSASPLNNETYNRNLSLRRINSVRNYLMLCTGSSFGRSAGNANLEFELEAMGESGLYLVSDKLDDPRNSVFSPIAAKARKVTIVKVAITRDTP